MKRLEPLKQGLFLFREIYKLYYERGSVINDADCIEVNLIWPGLTRLTSNPKRGARELKECENYAMLIPSEHDIVRTV